MSFSMSYTIDDGMIILNGKTEKVYCQCGKVIVIKNEKGAVMIKALLSLYDIDSKTLTVKCPKCRTINTIDIESNSSYGSISV